MAGMCREAGSWPVWRKKGSQEKQWLKGSGQKGSKQQAKTRLYKALKIRIRTLALTLSKKEILYKIQKDRVSQGAAVTHGQ